MQTRRPPILFIIHLVQALKHSSLPFWKLWFFRFYYTLKINHSGLKVWLLQVLKSTFFLNLNPLEKIIILIRKENKICKFASAYWLDAIQTLTNFPKKKYYHQYMKNKWYILCFKTLNNVSWFIYLLIAVQDLLWNDCHQHYFVIKLSNYSRGCTGAP